MMASQPAIKSVLSSQIENVGQGKITVSQVLYDRFLAKFHGNDGTVASNKNIISTDLENCGQNHHLQ